MSEPPEKGNKALLEKGLRLAMWISWWPMVVTGSVFGQAFVYWVQNGAWPRYAYSARPEKPTWLIAILDACTDGFFGGIAAGCYLIALLLAFSLLLRRPAVTWKLALRFCFPMVLAFALIHLDPMGTWDWWLD